MKFGAERFSATALLYGLFLDLLIAPGSCCHNEGLTCWNAERKLGQFRSPLTLN